MSLKLLSNLLKSTDQFKRLHESLDKPHASSRAQVLPNGVPFTLASLWDSLNAPMLVVTPRPEDARRLHDQMVLWTDDEINVLHFPENETLPFERLSSDVATAHQRLTTLAALLNRTTEPIVVVASAAALAQKTIDRDSFETSSHTLSVSDNIDLDDMLDLWRRIGYQFESSVYGPGFASRRGGIVDIFPVGSNLPARIDLWGNDIETMRYFNAASQRSDDMVDSISIIPAHETLPALTERDQIDRDMAFVDVSNCTDVTRDRVREEFEQLLDGNEIEDLHFYAGFFNRGSLLDYFPTDGVIALYRPTDIAEAAWDIEERAHDLRQAKEGRGELPYSFPSSNFPWTEVEAKIERVSRRLELLPWGADDLTQREIHTMPFTSPPTFLGKLDDFVEEASEHIKNGNTVVALTAHSTRLGEIFEDSGVRANLPDELDEVPENGTITVLQSGAGGIGEGFIMSVGHRKLALYGDGDIFGFAKQRRVRRRTSSMREAFFADLSLGDYVVHVEHGIGRFIGTGRMAEDDGGTEYLILQYAQSDKLYVPMEHLDRVSHYVAPMDHPPSLTRLGTPEWKRTKERVERSTREIAAELLSLYAARELSQGYAYPPDTHWQAELEESFPFEETVDQLSTLAEVKNDMESTKPMDRLVCGDVGYGKTEIALRAAFKAVMDGKQVAVLVPTTVLAQQHFITFSQRLSAYPAKVEVLSRFRSDKEQRDIIEGLSNGTVDICIGTHRLIQRDVQFKELGLVIVDEEQRFGVGHKERLKQMRREVDVLTLTATPIPRTLHMSLAGVRDMSTIDTPPEERLPIRTYVSEFSDDLIREAILRELDRQGQVYFLHNRVYNIDYMANYISKLVPEATVGIGHGQMPEGKLEETMGDFAEGKMDVLLCTTIIESGLDIPNVNTLIINRADTFGLAQLYQLRGRVGRSSRQAYSYLLIPQSQGLTEAAEKRLKAMLAATELGAGFRIAMKDLEIRGAGNILGAEQSGHIHAVGFDLYTRILSNAVEELRAQRAVGTGSEDEGSFNDTSDSGDTDASDALLLGKEPSAPRIDLGIPASVTDEYIGDLPTRIGIYQRLVQMKTVEELETMEDELIDRFGMLPWQVQNLLFTLRLKIQAHRAGIDSIVREGDRVIIRFRSEIGGARRAIQRIVGRNAELGNTQVRISIDDSAVEWEKPLLEMVNKLGEFTEKMIADMRAAVAAS